MNRFICKKLHSMLALISLSLVLTSSIPVLADSTEQVKVSEQDVLHLFYQRNLGLLAARYNIDLAQAQELIAGAIPNPTLGVQISELSSQTNKNATAQGCPSAQNGQNTSCGPAEYFSFSQLIETAGKRGLRMQSSEIATQAAESDFRDAVRILSNMVRDAYFSLQQAQKNRWLAQEVVQHYHDIVRDHQLRFKAGAIAESDLLRIDVEALKAQSDLENAQAAVVSAQANLAVVLNWPDKSLQFVADEQWPSLLDIGQDTNPDSLMDKALALRPDLLADKQRAEQAEKELTLAHKLNYPDVTLTGGFARDPSNTALNSAFVGVSIPVPLFYQYQGEAGKAATNLSKARLTAQETELVVRNDIVNAYANWQSANKVVGIFETDLLKKSTAFRDKIELAYNKGAVSILAFIDAERNYKAVMLDYYSAMTNRINAYYDLAKALAVEPNTELNQQLQNASQISSDKIAP